MSSTVSIYNPIIAALLKYNPQSTVSELQEQLEYLQNKGYAKEISIEDILLTVEALQFDGKAEETFSKNDIYINSNGKNTLKLIIEKSSEKIKGIEGIIKRFKK